MCHVAGIVPVKSVYPHPPSGDLIPGGEDIRYLRLLFTICLIRNIRMQKALEDVLVRGHSRQVACKNNAVSQSYFSQKFHHIQMVNHTVIRLCQFQTEERIR